LRVEHIRIVGVFGRSEGGELRFRQCCKRVHCADEQRELDGAAMWHHEKVLKCDAWSAAAAFGFLGFN
jgi:hypothetical protein